MCVVVAVDFSHQPVLLSTENERPMVTQVLSPRNIREIHKNIKVMVYCFFVM